MKLYLIFGRERNKAFKMLMKGESKQRIKKETGCTVAVNGANFYINEGEIFVIMGLSGSGKSSLLRCINRLNKPTFGAITINGKNIATMTDEELRKARRKELAMVFQHFGLLPHRTVLQNIAFGLELQGVEQKECKLTVFPVIDADGILQGEVRLSDLLKLREAKAKNIEPIVRSEVHSITSDTVVKVTGKDKKEIKEIIQNAIDL